MYIWTSTTKSLWFLQSIDRWPVPKRCSGIGSETPLATFIHIAAIFLYAPFHSKKKASSFDRVARVPSSKVTPPFHESEQDIWWRAPGRSPRRWPYELDVLISFLNGVAYWAIFLSLCHFWFWGLLILGVGKSRGGQVCVRLSYKYLLVLSTEVLLVLKSQVSLSLSVRILFKLVSWSMSTIIVICVSSTSEPGPRINH